MAQRIVNGKDMIFMIDPANGSYYDLVVCLTSNSYERSSAVIEASSKCGTRQLPGTKTRTIQIEGEVEFESGAGRMSEADLNTLFENDTPFGWLFGPETPIAGDVYYTGVDAILSNLTISAPTDGAATFSGTVQLNGVPVQITES